MVKLKSVTKLKQKKKAKIVITRIKSVKKLKKDKQAVKSNNNKPVDQKEKLKEQILLQNTETKMASKVTTEKENLMNLLLDIQETENYLPKEKLIALSKDKQIPGVEIYGVGTFYAQFKLTKPGKYKISLCRGTACHVKNSAAIIEYLQEYLGIKVGQTTEDNLFTLETVNCIGACAKAPAMMINGQVYGELTKEKVKKMIDQLKKDKLK